MNYLKKGQSITNPVFWKRVQLCVALLGVLLPPITLLFPAAQVIIDKGVIASTLAAIATVNAYLTVATTDKIGI
jgi:hypothetical protein